MRSPLIQALVEIRSKSRWSNQEDFARQVGLSLGGYRKYETGERIPTAETIEKIITWTMLDDEEANKLRQLRANALGVQVGLGPQCRTQQVDCDALARRIRTELAFVLKQGGIDINDRTKEVMEKRITMILKAVLEKG